MMSKPKPWFEGSGGSVGKMAGTLVGTPRFKARFGCCCVLLLEAHVSVAIM